MKVLIALESIANNSLSTNFLHVVLSPFPSTDNIRCFNIVVVTATLFSLAKPLSSASIFFWTLWVNKDTITVLLLAGKVNSNSFLPVCILQSITLSSNLVKSAINSISSPDVGLNTFTG